MYLSIAGRLQRRRRATARRLHRVNHALSAWDEYDCAANMPAEGRATVQRPVLERATLKELQGMLLTGWARWSC